MTLKYFSMFSGIGGFELGIEASNIDAECVGYSEVDKYAISIYEKNFPNHKGFGDATEIRTEELPEFDLLVGGFPCQAFSVAGHRRGFDDTRGTLFFEIARVLRDKRPKYFLLENVKGLLSHDKGKTFQTILEILSDLGYYVKWEVYNSKEFVPQNRERIFLEGYLRDRCGGEVLHQPRKGRETVEGEVKSLMKLNKRPQAQTIYDPEGLACCLSANGGGDGGKTGLYRVNELNLVNPQYGFQRGNIYDAENGLSPALCATDYKDPVKILDKCMPVLTPDRMNKRQNGRRMKEDGEPSFTLTATDRHGVSNGVRVRKLTPTECERLQAFPDGWTETGANGEKISNTQRYKCLGNAVTTKVVTYIINQMFDENEE